MSNLPVSTERHHKLFVQDPVRNVIFDFCSDALLIPVGHITGFSPVPNMDAYYVYTRTGWRFTVTGPEIYQWDKDPLCAPERDTVVQ